MLAGGLAHFLNGPGQEMWLLGGNIRDSVGTTGNSLAARSAVPDTDGVALDVDLSAEGTGVLGVLGDFHLLHLLTQGSTVSVVRKNPVSISLQAVMYFEVVSGLGLGIMWRARDGGRS